MSRAVPLLLALGLLVPPLAAQARFDLFEVAWTMSPDPGGEKIEMEMRLEPLFERDRIVVRVPWWRPGSYRFAAYERKISGLRATDGTGAERKIVRLDPRTWEIETAGAEELTVRYELEVENIAAPGATPAVHLHGPATFLYVEDALEHSHTLRFRLPAGWEAASGHRQDSRDPGLLRAPGYDVFVDCPIVLGALERHEFQSHGRTFDVVLCGRVPDEEEFPRAGWLDKLEAISDAAHRIMGGYPFERYAYLFLFDNRAGLYGLEHLNSTTISVGARVAVNNIDMLESVTAHEFFHVWNVKRIRPVQLGPFDYASDVRTRDLWWMEGLTSYYGDLILQRAGLRPEADWFWNAHARVFQQMQAASGYGHLSPERSSWTVWNPDRARQISYYDQGQVLGLLLDLKIRAETGNRRSLDDVFRFLHRWVDYPGAGYRPGDLERAVRAVTGWDCARFFDHHVSGLVPPPFEEVLPPAGLEVLRAQAGDPYLGFAVDEAMLVEVRNAAPAHAAGLRTGDQLLSIDGRRLSGLDDLRAALAGLEAGDQATVVVRRGDGNRTLRLEVQRRSRSYFRIQPDPDATPEQRAIREGVLRGIPQAV